MYSLGILKPLPFCLIDVVLCLVPLALLSRYCACGDRMDYTNSNNGLSVRSLSLPDRATHQERTNWLSHLNFHFDRFIGYPGFMIASGFPNHIINIRHHGVT